MTKTHYKKLMNPDYLGAYDFSEGEERLVTPRDIKLTKVIGPDGKSDECIVVWFSEPFKPMILNATNCKMLRKLNDSPFIEDWIGKTFVIKVVQVRAFGDMVDALRIKPDRNVRTLPELVVGTANFEAVRKALKAGNTMDQVRSKYTVTPETEAALNA